MDDKGLADAVIFVCIASAVVGVLLWKLVARRLAVLDGRSHALTASTPPSDAPPVDALREQARRLTEVRELARAMWLADAEPHHEEIRGKLWDTDDGWSMLETRRIYRAKAARTLALARAAASREGEP